MPPVRSFLICINAPDFVQCNWIAIEWMLWRDSLWPPVAHLFVRSLIIEGKTAIQQIQVIWVSARKFIMCNFNDLSKSLTFIYLSDSAESCGLTRSVRYFASGPLIEWVQRAERKGMRDRGRDVCMHVIEQRQPPIHPPARTFTRTPSKRHRWTRWQLTTRNLSGAFGTPFLPPFKWLDVSKRVTRKCHFQSGHTHSLLEFIPHIMDAHSSCLIFYVC